MREVIAVDIGGTAIKYGKIIEGKVCGQKEKETQAHLGGRHILNRVLELIQEELEEGDTKGAVEGVAISTAGMVDVERGEIFHAGPTIPDYKGVNLKRAVEDRFHLPCEVENDVNCAGLAEYYSGAGKGASSLLCLTIGTGIGGCAVLGGEVWHGFCGSALEVGYLRMREGVFEELGSTKALTLRVAQKKGEDPALWSGRRVFETMEKGDEDCIRELDRMCDYLGEGISNLVYVLNPELVVLGGGIMAREDYLYPRIRRAMDRYLVAVLSENTRLSMASQKNEAGMLGAYYHFRKRRERMS